MTLSERKREELTDLLMCYLEPLMDRFQCASHLQSHRKYLERLCRYKRQDAIIGGRSTQGINAQDMAKYSFSHMRDVLEPPVGQGVSATKGMDPDTGNYTNILKYEGTLSVKQFEYYIKRYASSGKVNLYETVKSFFKLGPEIGMTKVDLARLLINLLKAKEVNKEHKDIMFSNIYLRHLENEVEEKPHKTIMSVIEMITREY